MKDMRRRPNGESDRMTAPSLQDLVAEHGGWHLIPDQAWLDFDEACEAFYEWNRTYHAGRPA